MIASRCRARRASQVESACSAPFLRALWLVCASKVYSGLGADIVMESLHSLTGRAVDNRSDPERLREVSDRGSKLVVGHEPANSSGPLVRNRMAENLAIIRNPHLCSSFPPRNVVSCDCPPGTQSQANPKVTTLGAESPRVRFSGTNGWRIETGQVANSDVGFWCEILC